MNELYNKVPLYCKLAETLEEKINHNVYKKGERIPSERELCEQYDVSRMTVRLAIEELERQGKVEKRQGKGTFVLSKSINQDLKDVYSFSREMERQGKISTTQIICRNVITADEKVACHLEIQKGDQVIYLERLRCAEDVAIMLEKTWFPYQSFSFLMNIDFGEKGLYKTLQEDYGIRIDRAIEKFKATELNANECKLLHCPKNQFGLLVKRTSYSEGKLVSYSTIVSKGDIFEFTVQLNS
ncbi:MAG: GntR family transcriptional regulator [Solobacterium sp.]|jgi:GntR family transcriptional regulator|nr:GntR family transcriptional regulator [Solobacterium sp.]MCH4266008.1 GntR family transcriptional regulator [Solobacterium sp.]